MGKVSDFICCDSMKKLLTELAYHTSITRDENRVYKMLTLYDMDCGYGEHAQIYYCPFCGFKFFD